MTSASRPQPAQDPRNVQLYAFMDEVPTPVLVVSGDGLVAFANRTALAEFGYARDELLGRPVEILLPPDRAARHVAQRAEFMARPSHGAMSLGRDLTARRRDGTIFPAEISLIPVEWNGRRLVVASVIDITTKLQGEATLEELNRFYLTLAHLNQAIVRAPDELALFAQTCQIAVDEGGYQGAWVGKHGDGHSVTRVASAGSLEAYIARLEISTDASDALGRGPTGRVMRDGRSYYSQDFLTDDATRPWRSLGESFGIKSTATLPLRCAGQVVATLSLYSLHPGAFTDDVRALLEGMADNISFALDGFDTVARLQAGTQQRAELAQRLVAAQEAERARIAADVHDDSVQALAALDLRLGLLKRQVVTGAPEAVQTVEELHRTVKVVSAGLRDLLFQLEPPAPGSHLLDMLEEAGRHVFEDSGIRCTVVAVPRDGDPDDELSQTDRGQALRIVKEALFNVRKHSGATRVDVTVEAQDSGVEIEVRDDGTGFDARARTSHPGHRGLANMFDRAQVSGGWCRIASDDGGTSVRLWMPYAASASPGATADRA